jgi:SAM-dependent methyltransferase
MTAEAFEQLARDSRTWLSATRASFGNPGFEWYPYDSLANLDHLRRAFGDRYLAALDLAPGKQIADIGCGDGDLSFCLERLGCAVDAIDFPVSNHNEMRGIRALQQKLNSRISIHEIDLDSQFSLPRRSYDLVVFLGILYHLKNPLYVMERLAMHTRFCILSTRVARCFPGGKPMPPNQPIAYLVGNEELNRDSSNFWVFSHAGLKRLLERTQWRVLAYASTGQKQLSNPVDADRDERVFCLLESHYGLANVDLLEGWHEPEREGTRWTQKKFSARINLATIADPDRILLRVWHSEEMLARLGTRRLSIRIDGVPVAPALLDQPGYLRIARRFQARGSRSIVVEFELDAAIPPDAQDQRERGIVVVSLDCE